MGGVFFCTLLSVFLALPARGAPNEANVPAQRSAASIANAGFNDGIDRSDPNFVTASLLIMSPGDELYSCAGHACIRLECPTFNLDYCFSYESESVKEKVLTFFLGKLKMGMFAIPTEEYLKLGRESGRGVMQYPFNLPPDVKQRLWKILDERAAQGANLPYDYVKRGCGRAVRVVLQEALLPLRMDFPPLPEKYKKTRRELWDDAVVEYPWNRFFLHSFCGTEHDWDVSDIEKIIMPNDLVEFFRLAKVEGRPLIDGEGTELLSVKQSVDKSCFRAIAVVTPFFVACFVVVIAAANWFMNITVLDWFFLAFQSAVGLFLTYLIFFSSLPATSWHWLIVPFNLLPAIFWKWRGKWALWFAAALVLWECGMILYPHRLTDPAYLVLVAAFVLMYVRIGCPWRVSRHGIVRVGFGSGRDASSMRPPTV
jgi:hypothetical protein